MLGAFLFEDEEVFKKISTLSGGERARVAILKLILSNANFLLTRRTYKPLRYRF